MAKERRYVFVLWGDKFEETTATIFTTELRAAGLRVKVVGLSPQQIRGAYGLALVPDLTLDQALSLAAKTLCLVIPYASPGIKRLKNDPRLSELLQQAQANRAKFVIGQLSAADVTALGLSSSSDQLISYPHGEDLVEFARKLADSLSTPI